MVAIRLHAMRLGLSVRSASGSFVSGEQGTWPAGRGSWIHSAAAGGREEGRRHSVRVLPGLAAHCGTSKRAARHAQQLQQQQQWQAAAPTLNEGSLIGVSV